MSFLGGSLSITSIVTQGVEAVETGGLSLAAGTALKGVVGAIGDSILQQVGQQLGLPQSVIDTSSALLHEGSGDPAGAAQHLQAAVSDLANATGGTALEQGQFANSAQSYADQLCSGMIESMKNSGGRSGGEATNGQSFLEKLAIALGSVLDQKLNDMMDLSNQIGSLGTISNSNQSQLGMLTGKMQAEGQEVSMLSNALDNSIKSTGDAMSTLAKKN